MFEWVSARKLRAVARQVVCGIVLVVATQKSDAAPNEVPRVLNGSLETSSVHGTLESTIRGLTDTGPRAIWVGYSVPKVLGKKPVCVGRGGGDSDTCWLGRDDEGTGISTELQCDGSSSELWILYKIRQGQVRGVRIVARGVTLDAGGLPLVWLSGVRPADSVRELALLIQRPRSTMPAQLELAQGALTAIALHGDDAAPSELSRIGRQSESPVLREKALFWLAKHGGQLAERTIADAVVHDPDLEVREQAIYAFTQLPDDKGRGGLIEAGMHDGNAEVRKKALFWLAKLGGAQAEDVIMRAIKRDPVAEVKEQAVYALTQLPGDSGIPQLIQTAQTAAVPGIRGKALFWLAKQGGERAQTTIMSAVESDTDLEVRKQAVFALSQLPGDAGLPRLIEVARTSGDSEIRLTARLLLARSDDIRALQFLEVRSSGDAHKTARENTQP